MNQPDPWSQQGSQGAEDETWRTAPPPQVNPPAADPMAAPATGGYPQTPEGQSGAPQATQNTWGQPYGTAAGQPVQPAHPYAGYSAQPGQPGVLVDNPASKGGLTGLILACSALILSVILSAVGGSAYAELITAMGIDPANPPTQIDQADIPPGLESKLLTVGFTIFGQLVPTGLGIAGLIVSATKLKWPSQKKFALPGLIIALAAPVVSFIVFMVLLSSAVQM